MNMSYCRFYNTKLNVDQCIEALEDWDETLSDEEIRKGKEMFRNFLTYCLETEIIDSYEEDMIEKIFAEKSEEGKSE